jgi:hypothetical protein
MSARSPLLCLTRHTENGSELAQGLCVCRAALTIMPEPVEQSRFPPEEFVNDSQQRRETSKQEEEKIQVGIVPTHVQLQFDPRPKGR